MEGRQQEKYIKIRKNHKYKCQEMRMFLGIFETPKICPGRTKLTTGRRLRTWVDTWQIMLEWLGHAIKLDVIQSVFGSH